MSKPIKYVYPETQALLNKMLLLCAEKPMHVKTISDLLNVTTVSVHRYADYLIDLGQMYVAGYAKDDRGRLQLKMYATGNLPSIERPKAPPAKVRQKLLRDRIKSGELIRVPRSEKEMEVEEFLDMRKKEFKFIPPSVRQSWFSGLECAA
jgi:hypothetical protein